MSTINDSDLLLVERNGNLHQITYDQMSTLNDDDILLVERGGVQYKVEAQYVSTGANGLIIPPVEVLTPLDRAGDPELTYLKSDTILAVEDDGGSFTFETDTISSVEKVNLPISTSGTLFAGPVSKIFEPGSADVGQSYTEGTGSIWTRSPFTMTLNLPYTQKVEIVGTHTSSGSNGLSINGEAQQQPFVSNEIMQKVEVLTGSGTLNTLTIYGAVSDQIIISQIWIDGVQVLDATILSFPTSNNFDKFAVGDVAQNTNAITYLSSSSVTNPEYAFDNNSNTYAGFNTTGAILRFTSSTTVSDITFHIRNNSSTQVQSFGFYETTGNTLIDGTWNTVTGTSVSSGLLQINPGVEAEVTFTATEPLTQYLCGPMAGVSNDLFLYKITGVGAKITAIDANATPNPTITVNGGEWGLYDDSRFWSDGISGGSSGGKGLFNNPEKSNSNYLLYPGQVVFNPPIPFTTLVYGASNLNGTPIQINGVDSPCNSNAAPDATPITYTGSDTELTSISTGAQNGTGIFFIEIDGKVLIDAVNESEVWSNDCTATPLSQSDVTNLFDGDLSSAIGSGGSAGTSFTITLPSSLNSGNLVAYRPSIYAAEFSLNGSAYVTCPSSLGEANTSLPLQSGTNTLVVRGTGSHSATLSGISVDGVLLVDAGVRDLGATSISKTLNYATKLTLAGDTDLAQMALGPAVMTDGVLGGSGYSQTPYTLTTPTIESVTYAQRTLGTWYGNIDTPNLGNRSVNGDTETAASTNVYDSVWVMPPDNIPSAAFTFPIDPGRVTSTAKFVFDPPIPINSKLEIHYRAYKAQGGTGYTNPVQVNNTPIHPYIGDTKAWYDISAAGFTQLESFTFQNVDAEYADIVYAFRIDDKIVIDDSFVLTFPGDVSTNPDLRYFEAGDAAQSTWDQSQTWSDGATLTFIGGSSDPTVMFDGANGTYSSGFGTYNNDQVSASFTNLPTPTYSQRIYIGGEASPSVLMNGTHTVGGGTGWFDAPLEQITSLFGQNTVSPALVFIYGIEIDGKLLVDNGVTGAPGPQVLSTDLAANTMTVDGGEWLAVETFDFNHLTDITQLGSPTTFQTEGYSSPDSTLAGRFDPVVGSGAELNFDPPIAVANKVSLNCSSSSGVVEIVINDGEATGAYPTTRSLVDIAFTGNVSKIRLQRTAGYDAAYCDGIFFDGVRLVDQAYESNTFVATTIPGGTGDIVEIDQANNAVYLTEGDRAWIPSNNFAGTNFALAAGSLGNPPAPDYLDIAFTSMNAGTTPFSGVSANLSSRTWTLETAPAKSGPWTLVDTYEEFDMLASQDGATPWTTGKPVLNQSTWYRVKVTYNSTAAESVESDYHTFKTGV